MSQTWLRIGLVARGAGVSADTIRYYEKRKLLPRSPRSEGGFRLFPDDTIQRVRFIKQAQEMGFSLDEVRTLLTGGDAGACRQMRDLLRGKLEQTTERIRSLQEFKRTLTRHLQTCEDELGTKGAAAKCPVIIGIGRAAKQEVRR